MSEIPEDCTCSDCHPWSSHQIENESLKQTIKVISDHRRFELTCAALTGLTAYCGNSPLNAVNAVRMADEAIAALAMPASNG